MRFVNSIELSSILVQPRICSSNRLGAMASWRDEGHFEMAKKVARKVWRQITPEYLEKLYESMPRRMAAVIEAHGGHTKY